MPEIDPARTPTPERVMLRRRIARLVWRGVALLGVALAVVGAVLPVMPTVPFLLLAAWAASKGWPEFEAWLLAHRHFGPPIRQWRERGAVPRRAKWISSLMMACSAIGMQFFGQIQLWARVAVPAVMLAVAVWLWLRPES